MANNGSPAPIFETDDNCTHVLVTLPPHPDYVELNWVKIEFYDNKSNPKQRYPTTKIGKWIDIIVNKNEFRNKLKF